MTRPPILVPTLLLVAACGSSATGGRADPGTTRVPVELAPVSRDSLVETLALPGRLTPRPGGAALLTAPAAGVVRSVPVQVGDQVPRGGLVARLDVPELAADARQKEAAAALAEREAARQHGLLADGISSARQAEEATTNARQAAAGATAARDLLARTRVTSPIRGQVQDVLVQQGERVEAGRPLAQIVAGGPLDVVVRVPAPQLGRLRVGQAASVVQEGDSVPVAGQVAAITPGVDSLTNAGSVVVRTSHASERLHPGAGAMARIRIGVVPDALVVPEPALVLAGDRSVVFVVGPDSIAHQRAVVPGVHAEGRTAVRGDLRPGERVVTTGAFGLQDGMRVVPSSAAGAHE